MIDRIKRLSYSSIKLLNEDQFNWFQQYVKGIRDTTYHDYFVVGKAFHLVVENYNKTGEKNIELGKIYIIDESNKLGNSNDIYKELGQLEALYENYFDGTEVVASKAEEKIEFTIDGVNFIAILDAIVGERDEDNKTADVYIEDYKAVSSFCNEDNDKGKEKLAEYYIQGGFYMLSFFEMYGYYPTHVRFTEVKKSKASLKYFTKDKIIEMCSDFVKEDEKLTKDKLIEKYNLKAKCKNIIDIPFNHGLIFRCRDIAKNAIQIISNMKEETLTCPFGHDEFIRTLLSDR